jgi:hypothetical protein
VRPEAAQAHLHARRRARRAFHHHLGRERKG